MSNEDNNNHNSSENREWLINIIIGIRKEVLTKLRALVDSFDREKYTLAQRKVIRQEITEIAELVKEKDSAVKKREELRESHFVHSIEEGSLIDEVRKKAIKQLHEIRKNILAIEYDGEYAIIDKELNDIENLVNDKDKLIRSRVSTYYRGGKMNPYLSKYFKMDENQDK